ncbi:MAG: glyoxalase, partial [Sphaerisporangium sp.]|nr:glyoxalase [Sphaerisporangium sp.]
LDTDDGAVEIRPREGFGGLQPTLVFSPTTEPKAGKLRLHIDVRPVIFRACSAPRWSWRASLRHAGPATLKARPRKTLDWKTPAEPL